MGNEYEDHHRPKPIWVRCLKQEGVCGFLRKWRQDRSDMLGEDLQGQSG